MTLATLEPEQFREAARQIIQPRNPQRHWLQTAEIVGVTEDRQYYQSWGFASTRAWAEQDLGLSHAETYEALKLWRMVVLAELSHERWLAISKGKALIVARALQLGGNPERWVALALAAESEEDLREALARMLDREVWVHVEFRMPEATKTLLDAALMKALLVLRTDAPDMTLDAARAVIYHREVAHQLVEELARTYITAKGEG